MTGCGNKKDESIKDVDINGDQIIICKTEEKTGSETYNNITDTYEVEITSVKSKPSKITYTDKMKATSLDEYDDSIVIEYYRSSAKHNKSTAGVIYEYNDDYNNLIATYKFTLVFNKMTYAEKDEFHYNELLDDDGELLSTKEFINKLEKEDYKCSIKED